MEVDDDDDGGGGEAVVEGPLLDGGDVSIEEER